MKKLLMILTVLAVMALGGQTAGQESMVVRRNPIGNRGTGAERAREMKRKLLGQRGPPNVLLNVHG